MERLEKIKLEYMGMTRQALNARVTAIILAGLIKQEEIFVIEYREHTDKDGSAQWEI